MFTRESSRRIVKSVWIALGVAMLGACNPDGESTSTATVSAQGAHPVSALPTRSACIVKFKMDLQGEPASKEFQDMLERIGPLLAEARTGEAQLPVSGLTYPDHDSGDYYIQYSRDCGRKYEMTDWLVTKKFSEKLPIHSYEISHEMIIPSTKTIDIRGEHWSDGEGDDS